MKENLETQNKIRLQNSNMETLSTTQIVELTKNSVVEIETEIITSEENKTAERKVGAGSGVIWPKNGYIVTNAHVVKDAIVAAVEKQYKEQHQKK